MLCMGNTEQRGTAIENGSEWSNRTVYFDRACPTEKSCPPRKVHGPTFLKLAGWTEPIHSVLDQNFRKFGLNGSRPSYPNFTFNTIFIRTYGG